MYPVLIVVIVASSASVSFVCAYKVLKTNYNLEASGHY